MKLSGFLHWKPQNQELKNLSNYRNNCLETSNFFLQKFTNDDIICCVRIFSRRDLMSTEMLMKNRERFIKNVNSNENGAAALSLRLFCYARFMAVKNPYAETHDWVYENELTNAQANQYVFRLLDESTERPSMDMLIRKLKSVRLVRDNEMNGRKIYVIKFTDIEMEELMNKSIIDKPSDKLLKEKKSSVKKEKEEVVNSSWKEVFLKNSKGENLQILRFWFYIQYNAEKNGKKYISKSQALSEGAIEYVYKGIPKKMDVLKDLFALMKQLKLLKEDVVKNEIVIRPAKLEGIEIKDYIKDKPVDLNSFNYTNV